MPPEFWFFVRAVSISAAILGVISYRGVFFPLFPRFRLVQAAARTLRVNSFAPRFLSAGLSAAMVGNVIAAAWLILFLPPGWWRLVGLVVLCQPTAWVVLHYSRARLRVLDLEQTFFQKRRNRLAERIWRRTLSGSSGEGLARTRVVPAYSLWLRSFETLGQNLVLEDLHANSREQEVGGYKGAVVVRDVNMPLAKILEAYCPLIAVGGSEHAMGAGHISCAEADWRSVVTLLMEHARYILILPNPTEGLTWEIAQVFESRPLLEKALFIVPPSPRYAGRRLRSARISVQVGRDVVIRQDVNDIAREVLSDILRNLGLARQFPEDAARGLAVARRATGDTAQPLRSDT